MANLSDRTEARTALRRTAPGTATAGRRMLLADPTCLGPLPAPLLAWVACVVAVLGAVGVVATGFSVVPAAIALAAAAVGVVLYLRAHLAAAPEWEKFWTLYVATADAAGASLYTSSPAAAWFTLDAGARSAHVTFPEGSNGMRPDRRRKAAEAACAAWQTLAAPDEVVLYELGERGTFRVWTAPIDDDHTSQHRAGQRVNAAANRAASRTYDKEGGVEATVLEWTDGRPSQVRIWASDGLSLYSYGPESFTEKFLADLSQDRHLIAEWQWSSATMVHVNLYPEGHPEAARVMCSRKLYDDFRDLVDYSKRDQLLDVRVDSYEAGPVHVTFRFDTEIGATPAAHLWPPQLRAKLLEAYPDRVFAAPTFRGQLAHLQAVERASESGQLAVATAHLDALLTRCAREPVTVTTFTGALAATFTAVGVVRSDKVAQTWWRNSLTEDITAAIPGVRVDFDIPTSRVALTRG